MSHFLPAHEAVAALRAAADLIEMFDSDSRFWYVETETYNVSAEELAAAVRLPGKWEKNGNDNFFTVRQGIVELHGDRQKVCEAVPTGRTVKVRKQVAPPTYAEVEVPEVEWRCAPLLAVEVER